MYTTLRRWLAPLGLAFLFFLLAASLVACSPKPEVVSIQGHTMGTTYHISWVEAEADPAALQSRVDARLEQINDSMSTWREHSLLSQFNRLSDGTAITMDADFATVLAEALRLGELTGGALDVTLGPLVNLWGFGPEGQVEVAPDAATIAEIKATTGLVNLVVEGQSVRKAQPGLYLDLSAIAKGYGVDAVAELLEGQGIRHYLVEVGGEMRLKGQKPDGKAWRIAIERPDPSGRAIFSVIEPGDNAVATSGDYRNFFEQDGRRYSHLIDPRSGEPVENAVVSATVLHPSAMTADGLATAMMVLDTQASLALANAHQWPVMIIEKQPRGFEVHYSEAFQPFIPETQP